MPAATVSALDVFRQIVRLLSWVDRVAQALLRVYQQRLVAVGRLQTHELLALNQQEVALQTELKQLGPKRAEILRLGQRLGFKMPDLKSLLQALRGFTQSPDGIDPEQYQLTVAWLKRVEALGRDLQRQVWTNWHVIQRTNRELLELRGVLAGDSNVMAGGGGSSRTSRGGVLLDAKV